MANRYSSSFPPYVSVAARKAQAEKAVRAMEAKGKQVSPVVIAGKKITTTFWGDAWCSNLERFSDYSSRIERGKAYARNGAVIDLQIDKGQVRSLVSGSSIYKVTIGFQTLTASHWAAFKAACGGQIGSVVELLRGTIDKGVMAIVTRPGEGLFPVRNELTLTCSCPDSASMCKHIAATLYGVGARLDTAPELLFLLRGVDPNELINAALAGAIPRDGKAPRRRVLAGDALSSVFGVDIDLGGGGGSPRPATSGGNEPEAKTKSKAKAKAKQAQESPPTHPPGPLACALVHAFPARSPELVVVVDIDRRSAISFTADELDRLRSGLAAYDVLVGVDIEAMVAVLRVEPGPYRLIDLQKTLPSHGGQEAPTLQALVVGTCKAPAVLKGPAECEAFLARGKLHLLRARLESEAKSLSALFNFGRLHGGVRARVANADTWFVVPWCLGDGTSLNELKAAALKANVQLDVVLGIAPGWSAPWSRRTPVMVQRASKRGGQAILVSYANRQVEDLNVQLVRLAPD